MLFKNTMGKNCAFSIWILTKIASPGLISAKSLKMNLILGYIEKYHSSRLRIKKDLELEDIDLNA